MRANNALTPDEVDEGWVLTCQSHPHAAPRSSSTTTPDPARRVASDAGRARSSVCSCRRGGGRYSARQPSNRIGLPTRRRGPSWSRPRRPSPRSRVRSLASASASDETGPRGCRGAEARPPMPPTRPSRSGCQLGQELDAVGRSAACMVANRGSVTHDGPAELPRQPAPELVVGDEQGQVPVARLEQLRRHVERVRAERLARRGVAAVEVGGRLVVELGQHHVVERDVDLPALALDDHGEQRRAAAMIPTSCRPRSSRPASAARRARPSSPRRRSPPG